MPQRATEDNGCQPSFARGALAWVSIPSIVQDTRAPGRAFRDASRTTTTRVVLTRAALQGEGSALDEEAFLARFDAYRDVYESRESEI
jgi:hypothetical protein